MRFGASLGRIVLTMFVFGSCGAAVVRNSCSDLTIGPQKQDKQTASLLHAECHVEELDCNCTEEAELIDEDLLCHYHQAKMTVATPPVELVDYLPEDHTPGRAIKMMGPHGLVSVVPPKDLQPGEKVRYRLAPPPEFRIEVPWNASPGSMVEFERTDGMLISVTVPPGLAPGDRFDVTPPSLLVRIPDGSLPGDDVIFQIPHGSSGFVGRDEAPWCRTQVPFPAVDGAYFAVRLPVPVNLRGADLGLSKAQE